MTALEYVSQIINALPLHELSKVTLLYFFSAVAQSAAAFIAVIGVFGIFKMQSNDKLVESLFRDCKYWLKVDVGLGADRVDYMSDQVVKRYIQDMAEGKQHLQFKDGAIEYHRRIGDVLGKNKKVAYDLAWPLKLWVLIFLFSIGIFPFLDFYIGKSGVLVISLYMIAAIFAVWFTKRFVQNCLAA